MSPLFLVVVVLLVIAQLTLPKHLAFLPLIVAGCQVGNVEILPEFTTGRILIVIGLGRAITGSFFIFSAKSKLDILFVFFSIITIASSIGHQASQWVPSPLAARAGLVLNAFGAYLYGRSYLPDLDAFRRYAFLLPIILIPLAVGMTYEHKTRRNLYHTLGARGEIANVREDRVRAMGPFRHSILAGTAGATALPFALLSWYLGRKKYAIIGLLACLGIVIACSSSGPLAAVGITVGSMIMWRWRDYLHWCVWGGVAFALFFVLYSGKGPWYLMASIDLVGGSTGWHRARLIDRGFENLNEWWLWGTDYTRHWMASGVSWNPNMVDMTNYYLHLGVIGGLALTLCVIAIIVVSFKMLFRRMYEMRLAGNPMEIVLWCAAASLAAHAISFVSISYFDQMYIYFYILLGAVPGLVNGTPSMLTTQPIATQMTEPVPVKALRYYS